MAAARVKIPAGEKITISHGKLQVPENPIVAFIEGDGVGPDIWAASVRVLDAAVAQAYKGRRKIAWIARRTCCPPRRSTSFASTWWPSRGR